MEWFFDFLFLGNSTNIAVSCPQELLNKYNNGSEIRKLVFATFSGYSLLPAFSIGAIKDKDFFDFMNTLIQQYDESKIYFYYTGVILLSVMILLNRKRFIKSLALRLFTNYYLGFLLLQFFFVVFAFLYRKLIWLPMKNKYVWCVKKYPTYDIYFPSRYEEYQLAFEIYVQHIADIYKNAVKHILPAFLILHRINTYCACAYPIIFQQYFTNKLLKIYYPVIGLFIFLLHFIAYNIAVKTEYSFELYTYKNCINFITVLFVLSHIIMAVLSVRVVIKYKKSSKAELQEFKSFLGFSMGPVIVTIIEQLLLLSQYFFTFDNTTVSKLDFTLLMSVLSKVLYDIQPEYLCILYLMFVPFYRKLLQRVFWCGENSSRTEVQILSTTNVSK